MIAILFSAAIMIAAVVFSFYNAEKSSKLYVWNKGHLLRFTFIFGVLEILTFFTGYIPKALIPISLFAVLLSILSDGFCALLCLVLLVSYYGILNPTDALTSACLLLGGAVSVAAFSEVELTGDLRPRIIAFMCGDFICSGLAFISHSGEGMLTFMLLSLIRVIASGFIVFAVLKVMADRYFFEDRDFYEEICDPENEYLMAMESASKAAYNRALHDAYLSEKLAEAMGYDVLFVKAGAYYLNAKKYELFNGVKLPVRFKRLLSLLWNNERDVSDDKNYDMMLKKQAALIRFTDMYIMAVLYSFKKNGNATPEYGKLTEVVVKKKIKEGDKLFTLFSLNELNKLKAACKAEKKYYEFLRRQ
ncbi:MAG TPA: hypothetical protein DCG85_00895 [Lachnospiraceae bacterium]|nr:hypothetical protein [Lachnospiraceae bacterium]